MKKFLLPLLLLPVLFISGCTSCGIPGTGITLPFCNTISLENDIVVIKDITAIPTTVTASQPLKLIVAIQNNGDKAFPINDANVEVELYDYCPGLFNKPELIGCKGSTDTKCTITTLLPNEIKEVVWELKPKEDTKLITRCTFKVSVRYPYTTDGLTTINFINYQEYLRQQAAGTLQTRSSTTTKGEGPVKVWYEIGERQPIPAMNSDGNEVVPVTLKVENVGAGFVVAKKDDNNDQRPTVTLQDTENSIFKDPFKIDDETNKQDECNFHDTKKEKQDVPLIQRKASLPCWIKRLTEVSKETTRQLTSRIVYLYEFRGEATVTVEPQ